MMFGSNWYYRNSFAHPDSRAIGRRFGVWPELASGAGGQWQPSIDGKTTR